MPPRTMLLVFPHPDDETSSAGATMARYAAEGVDIHVVTATRGELGSLGAGDLVLAREELPAVREAELREVLRHYGVSNPPIFLGYRDQEVKKVDFERAVQDVLDVMHRVEPDVVLAHGPHGFSDHEDHVALHHIAVEAFRRYRQSMAREVRLLYAAIPREIAESFKLALDGPETMPNVTLNLETHWRYKIQGLRKYRSQADAQELAAIMEDAPWSIEWFHQAEPPLPEGTMLTTLWPD